MNMVGAKRINRPQEYVGLRRSLWRFLTCETPSNQQQQTQEDSAVIAIQPIHVHVSEGRVYRRSEAGIDATPPCDMNQ